MAILKVNGSKVEQYHDVSVPMHAVEDFVHKNYGDKASFEVVLTEQEKKQKLNNSIRQKIHTDIGDTESLLGTTSDASQFLLYGFASLVAKLHTANSLAEVRQAAQPFSELSIGFLDKIEKENVRLPFMFKGVETVFEDIEKRSTMITDVLQSVEVED